MADEPGNGDLREFLGAIERTHAYFDHPPVDLQRLVDYHMGRLEPEDETALQRRAIEDDELRGRLSNAGEEIFEIEARPAQVTKLSASSNPFRFAVGRLMAPDREEARSDEASPSQMVGREEELKALLESLDSAGLTTIVGPAGVGKSTLLRTIAARAKAEFGMSSELFECGRLDSLDEFFELLGDRISMAGETQEALLGALDRQVRVLALDQAETGDFWPNLLQLLRDNAPATKIVICRRTALGIADEKVITLQPFAVPPDPSEPSASDILFIATARRAVRDFPWNAATRKVVREICHLAMGIPLCITMAAASLNHQSLNDTLHLFQTAPSIQRDQTGLRAAVNHSFQVLSQSDQVYLCRLSTFAGRFSFADAQLVCGVPERQLSDSLVQLLNAGLISTGLDQDFGQYLLHDSGKEHATALLGSQEWQLAVRDSVERYELLFAQRAREVGELMRQGRWSEGIHALHRGSADLRQAMRRCVEKRDRTRIRDFAIGLSRTYMETGRLADFEVLSNAALALNENSLTTSVLGLQGAVASLNGDSVRCTELWQRRRQMFEELGDSAGTADCLSDLAWECYEQGDIEQSARYLDEAERLSIEAGIWELAASMQVIRARIQMETGEEAIARQWIAVCEESLTKCSDRSLLPFVYQELSGLHRRLGQQDRAISTLKIWLRTSAEGERSIHAGRALLAMAPLYEGQGNAETAADCYMAAVKVLNEYQTKDRRRVEEELASFLSRYPEREGVFRDKRNTPWQEVVSRLV